MVPLLFLSSSLSSLWCCRLREGDIYLTDHVVVDFTYLLMMMCPRTPQYSLRGHAWPYPDCGNDHIWLPAYIRIMGIGIWPKNRDFYPDLPPTSAQIRDFLPGLVDDLLGNIGGSLCPQMEKESISFRGITIFKSTYPFWDSGGRPGEGSHRSHSKIIKSFYRPPCSRTGTCLNVAPIGGQAP